MSCIHTLRMEHKIVPDHVSFVVDFINNILYCAPPFFLKSASPGFDVEVNEHEQSQSVSFEDQSYLNDFSKSVVNVSNVHEPQSYHTMSKATKEVYSGSGDDADDYR